MVSSDFLVRFFKISILKSSREAGIVGHLLYLESEVIGMRSTGIGCYFDDPIHELLGFNPKSTLYQSIYHFTLGYPIIDTRISTLPPYQHLLTKDGKRKY